ncbi:hypothetical protein chiPu_0001203 [Chiloscyllium punctatum]|uniref:Uncharacterized protein n=1 Tax=Chiloscyllium punctatum TaxID=137246 RepID=A0A401RXE1_CHIPU|nr:hypothetical protein [Chiloscyllium punctatum]
MAGRKGRALGDVKRTERGGRVAAGEWGEPGVRASALTAVRRTSLVSMIGGRAEQSPPRRLYTSNYPLPIRKGQVGG